MANIKQKVHIVASRIVDELGLYDLNQENVERYIRGLRFNKKSQIEYLADYLTWIEDGNNPMQAARGVVAGCEGESKKPIQWDVSSSIIDALENGYPVVEGMRYWFDDEICALFESAKDSDSKTIRNMLTEYLGQQKLLSDVKNALIQPIKLPLIYSSVAFAGLYLMMIYMLPMFFQIVPLERWGADTQHIYSFMTWLKQYFILIVFVLIVVVLYLRRQLHTNISPLRAKIDQYYPFSLYKNIAAMRLMKFIGILVMLSENPAGAIKRVLSGANKWEAFHLEQMLDNIGGGEKDIAKIMDTGLLSKSVLFRLASVSNVSSDDLKRRAISHAADRSAGEIVKDMKFTTTLAKLASWLLVLVIGGLAVIQYVSIYGSLQSIR